MDTTSSAHSTERPPTPAEVGLLVRIYREAMGWTQETVAELSGLTVRTVQRVEAGQSSSFDTRRALARAFQISDLDVFSRSIPFPSEEELRKRKIAFDRDHLVLDATVVNGRGVVIMLLDGSGHAAIVPASMVELPRAAQDAFAAILDYARDCMDVADDASRTEMLSYSDGLDEIINELRAAGYCLCAAKRAACVTHPSWAIQTPIPLNITYLNAVPVDAHVSRMVVRRSLGPMSL